MKFLKFFFILFYSFISLSVIAQKESFSFVAFADQPYELPQDYQFLQILVDSINKQSQEFNVFLGDLKASRVPCEDTIYQKAFNYFNQLNKPLIYTPGDNEWTDCNTHNFNYNPLERLEYLRKTYFNSTIEISHQVVKSQSEINPYEKFIENKIWKIKNIQFATLHIVGSNNNLNVKFPIYDSINQEYVQRNKANLSWLNYTFTKAKNENAKSIVLLIHADVFTADKGYTGFTDFINSLSKLVEEYKKPVLLINGDSHKFLIDKPLNSLQAPYRTLTNFTRLQLYGEKDPFACIIKVDTNSDQIFNFQELLIPLK
jgi:hypothetical protein